MLIYGPCNYSGRYPSKGNAQFDRWPTTEDARCGSHDFEAVHALAASVV